ncbi:hypothetical protein HMPREF9120_00477 [Neisseria sp. oral taxon 020 str. F0370]|nr:hypothetical protein HMPREF9120_00477 [Neisseria sp. oral taxon 020 str. F0370]
MAARSFSAAWFRVCALLIGLLLFEYQFSGFCRKRPSESPVSRHARFINKPARRRLIFFSDALHPLHKYLPNILLILFLFSQNKPHHSAAVFC